MTRWFKGNLHTHTTESDGDASPDHVVRWYEEHQYNFLALTDHNLLTRPALSREYGLMLLPGEELTMALDVHVNGLGLSECIAPPSAQRGLVKGTARLELVRAALRAIAEQDALASVNHPNFRWALNFDVLSELPGLRFMEIFNGHPLVQNDGDRTRDGAEHLWDRLLSHGRRVWGLATDDAHHYHDYSPIYANPGRGWVWVQAETLSPASILQALSAGDFYASTGVRLAECRLAGGSIHLVVDLPLQQTATIELIGADGRVLEAEAGREAVFSLPVSERYVRGRVTAVDGSRAWLQPVFLS